MSKENAPRIWPCIGLLVLTLAAAAALWFLLGATSLTNAFEAVEEGSQGDELLMFVNNCTYAVIGLAVLMFLTNLGVFLFECQNKIATKKIYTVVQIILQLIWTAAAVGFAVFSVLGVSGGLLGNDENWQIISAGDLWLPVIFSGIIAAVQLFIGLTFVTAPSRGCKLSLAKNKRGE